MTGAPIRLLLDENVWLGLAEALRRLGHDALHVSELDRAGLADEDQLAFAAEQGRALLTCDVKDFAPLLEHWYAAGRSHSGIILSDQRERGELLRRVNRLLAEVSAEEMANAVRFLQEFK